MSRINFYIIVLTGYSVLLSVLDIFRLQWYIKEPSLCDEVFYFFVVLALCYAKIKEKRAEIFVNDRGRIGIFLMLGANLSLAIFNIIDAFHASIIKLSFRFKTFDDVEFGQVSKQIYYSEWISVPHVLMCCAVLTPLFAWALCKFTDMARK